MGLLHLLILPVPPAGIICCTQVCKLLAIHGALLNECREEDGITALHIAAQEGHGEVQSSDAVPLVMM